MKKQLITLMAMACFTIGAIPAQAEFWVGSVEDGSGNWADNVQTFDWASSGSGVATGVGPAGTPLVQGTPLNFRFQAFLFSVNNPDGFVVDFPGLNSSFEYTVVAIVPEVVASVTPLPGGASFAYFSTLEGGLFYVYQDDVPNYDVPNGTGFADGNLVAWGTVNPDQLSTFMYDPATGLGTGSFILLGQVAYANPDYLDPASTIENFRFEGTINIPPLESATTHFDIDDYDVAANDLILKVDASHKFTEREEVLGDCRVTAGGVKDDGITIPCELKNNGMPDKQTCVVDAWDTWGGQAGAQPRVDGNWTHHHVVSPRQSFVFHSNELFFIGCSDPGACVPAAANAENHQIDFAGIGHFTNQKGYSPELPDGDLCYTVHLEDIGEPGPGGKWPSSTENCTHCPGTSVAGDDCVDCRDYYEIKIYSSASNDGTGCSGEVIYYNGAVSANCGIGDPALMGYFTRSGNVQMHPDNN